MGQAKNRGTFEERKAQAVIRNREEEKLREAARRAESKRRLEERREAERLLAVRMENRKAQSVDNRRSANGNTVLRAALLGAMVLTAPSNPNLK